MSDDPLIGQVLHDTHEVLRLIGKGGMGSVYEARHVHLNKSFSVKVLDPRFAENDTIFTRFKREALISSSLGHPAIVQVSDFYIHDDGRPCMVMEYLEGEDLGELLKERKCLPSEELLEIVEQVASALQAVHDKEIVHRDMKPGNIFMATQEDGSVHAKVLDFGISKIRNPDDGVDTLTADATLLGTPHFMSPEQALGEVGDVDWRTDIFALGTICYYALSGKLPFNAPSLHGVLVKIQTLEPPPITGLANGLTGKVHLALQKAMAKDKADRYNRVEEFAADLREALTVSVKPTLDKEPESDPSMATRIDEAPVPAEEVEQTQENIPSTAEIPPAEEPTASKAHQVANPGQTNVTPLDELMGELEGGAEEPPPAKLVVASPELPEPEIEKPEQGSFSAVSSDTTLSASAGEQLTQKVPPSPERKSATLKVLAVAAVLMLALGGAYMATRSPGEPGPAAQVSAPIVAAASQPEPTAAPLKQPLPKRPNPDQEKVVKTEPIPAPTPAEKKVSVTLQVTPNTAKIFLDGHPRTENPLKLRLSDQQHRLRIEARGYKPHEQDLIPNADEAIKVDLSRAPPVASSKPQRARAKSAATNAPSWDDPFDKRPRPAAKKKAVKDDDYSSLVAPVLKGKPNRKPKRKRKPKKKTSEEAFDSL